MSYIMSQVLKADKDQQMRMALENDQAEMESLEDSLGFTRVIQKITESGKLVVGHNMLLDVAFTLNQFAAPLPTEYHEFKVILNQSISSNLTNVHCTTRRSPPLVCLA